MAIAALITWLATIGAGWSLLAIWLVEYDRKFQAVAGTRLPLPLIGAHALLALGGLTAWIAYLLAGTQRLAVTSASILGVVAVLGFTMLTRWIGVYRAYKTRSAPVPVSDAAKASSSADAPPERHLPVTLVIGHGLLAVATVVLVVLIALGRGS